MRQIKAYVRKNGDIGVRNHILVLASVVCANYTVQLFDGLFDEVIAVTHQHGCSQGGEDLKQTFRTLVGLAANPNVAGVLVIGLGCETIKAEEIASEVRKTGKPVSSLEIQECGGMSCVVEEGKKIITDMFKEISEYERQPVDISNLVVATECGGSDAFSGISANPAVGEAADLVVKNRGTVILSETAEMVGAENVLKKRCIDQATGDKLVSYVKRYEQLALNMGINICQGTTSPGNMKGGITTLEEKSLGCILKGGSSEIKEVIDYAQKPLNKGLVIMDTPGDDVESMSGMAAGGAHVIVFTTGRGTPTGNAVVPVIKVSSNTFISKHLAEHIDINTGKIIEGTCSIKEVGQEIFEYILKVSEGLLCKAELTGQRDFSINRIGATF